VYGFQVGNVLKVTLKEPAGDFEEGEFVSSDENLVVLDVFAHTPAAHWVYIPQGNISRIERFFPQPVTLVSCLSFKSAVEMG
jgi:hypothetical protein